MLSRKSRLLLTAIIIVMGLLTIASTSELPSTKRYCSHGYWKNHGEVWQWYFKYPGRADELMEHLWAKGGPNAGKPLREAAAHRLNVLMNLGIFPLADCD